MVNTGDFRVVLADSRGERITKDGFGSLDDKSLQWQGVHFRFHPHVFHRDLVHKSPHIPTSLYLRVIKLSTFFKKKLYFLLFLQKNNDAGIFSTKSMTKMHIWDGAFEVAPGHEDTLTIKILQTGSKRFRFTIEMNGYSYDDSVSLITVPIFHDFKLLFSG